MPHIVKMDALPASGAAPAAAHPVLALWLQPGSGLLARLAALLAQRGVHPARCVVLLPYVHLCPLATRLWAQQFPDGFAPRFETSVTWSRSLGPHQADGVDLRFDAAFDGLNAQALLRGAGLGAQQQALAPLLLQSVQQLAPLAAARAAPQRAAWVQQAQAAALSGLDGAPLALEAALARIALEWAGASAYASDGLFAPDLRAQVECLVLVGGFSDDPLAGALQAHWGAASAALPLLAAAASSTSPPPSPSHAPRWHACADAEEEAERAAACVLAHLQAGCTPVALVSSDRALSRRLRTLLAHAGVPLRDETGWKLSTSHAAASVMALLKAAVWGAGSDAVLAWLKLAPAFAASRDALEAALRRARCVDWNAGLRALEGDAVLAPVCAQVEAQRALLGGRYTLVQWQDALRAALQASALWAPLQQDAQGLELLRVLHFLDQQRAAWQAEVAQSLWSARTLDLAEFSAWVGQCLEAARHVQPAAVQEPVVLLPLPQMLGRAFAAAVFAGCDEQRFKPAPEPLGLWTARQRLALGLPGREVLQASTLAAWRHALLTPRCDVLWRCSDDSGEVLAPSALVRLVQEEGAALAPDPRAVRTLTPSPQAPPLPQGSRLPVSELSASAYGDLRQCPYRFFALRLLGLKPMEELEGGLDKRDFGQWLHAVLQDFHEHLARTPQAPRAALMDAASERVTQREHLSPGDFLPFAAAWPALRDGYLRWLEGHEAQGAQFARAEVARELSLGPLRLVGRLDRVDRLADGSSLLLDYKTEPLQRTQERVKNALEDTQLVFYSALLEDDVVQAAYVNLGERDGTRSLAQADIVEARDALVQGLLHDVQAIAAGAPLPALGAGSACDYCAARGLCRKDFWDHP